MTEEEKKKYLDKWQGGPKDAEAFQKGFQKKADPIQDVKDAWKSVASLFSPSANAKKEIASILNINIDTLGQHCQKDHGKTFPEYYEESSAKGSMSIRRAQYVLGVEKLDSAMLRHLGKIYLDQKDGDNQPVVTHIAISIDDIKKAVGNDEFVDVTHVRLEDKVNG